VAILVMVLIAAAMIGMMIMSAKARRARVEALMRVASGLGWAFEPAWMSGEGRLFKGPGPCDETPFNLFKFFHAGDSRGFSNRMTGAADANGIALRCEAGDYQWSTGSGKDRETHNRSYLLFDFSHDLGMPPALCIRPETLGDRVWDMIGGQDINFESEEFSRMFHVASPDKKFAFAVIHPRMMEFLMSGAPQHLEMNGGCGLLVSQDGVWDPADFQWAVRWAREFMAQWPGYLLEELRARTGRGSVGP
jgi:hypothetical protein